MCVYVCFLRSVACKCARGFICSSSRRALLARIHLQVEVAVSSWILGMCQRGAGMCHGEAKDLRSSPKASGGDGGGEDLKKL